MNELFGQGKILGMLENINFIHVDKVLPSLGDIDDQALHEVEEAPPPKIFFCTLV